MAGNDNNIASAMRQAQHNADAVDSTTDLDAWIGNEGMGKPRRREMQSADDLKKDLENEFLTPSPRFSTQWLNRLQKYVFFACPCYIAIAIALLSLFLSGCASRISTGLGF